jgi:anti-sigma B factor antagonist
MTAEDYRIEYVGTCAVIRMPAEIDVTNSERVRRALVAAAGQDQDQDQRPAVLIIDMSETTFCDSAGVQAIVAAHRHVAGTGPQLRLVAPGVERILTLVGVGQLVPLYPTVGAACGGEAGRERRPRG